jgi:Fic family protein
MKIPEKAPQNRLSPAFVADLPGMAGKIGDIYKKAQNDYLYWDKFKHLPMPSNVLAEDAWTFVKLMRDLNRKGTVIPSGTGGHYTYVVTENVMKALHNIDKWAGGWDAGTAVHVPHDAQRERHILNSLLEESIASSQIEGASTTRKRAREMLLNEEKPRDNGERMVLNNYRTMKRIHSLIEAPLTPQLLLELQESMTVDTLRHSGDVGVFRTSDDIVVADESNRVLYTPPKASEIPEMVEALCDYANRDDDQFEHPAIKAIALHFWLALIHPFADGNGRTARALFYLFMLKNNYWLFEYLSISRVILSKRARYERAYLYSETDDFDFTYFLLFNLRAIETALEQTRRYVEKKAAEDAEMQQQLQGDFELNYRQRAVVSRALKKPGATFTFQSHANSHGVVRATARADLLDLCDRGYLARHKDGRQIVFVPAPDLREKLTVNQVSIEVNNPRN